LWDACNFNPERRRRFAAGAQFSELLINNVVQGAAAAFKSSFRPAILPIPSAEWPHDYWIALIISAQARISFTEHRVLDYRQHGRNLIGARRPWRAPPTLLRGLGYRAGSWLKKLRSPTTYYTKQLDVARRELQSMSVLRERLMSLDQNTVGPAILLVDTELARLTHREAVIQGRMRRWTRMAPGASRASET
jgi:hypothetical protein